MPKNMLVDTNNLGFITRFSKLATPASKRQKDPMAAQMIMVSMIEATLDIARRNQVDAIVLTLDAPHPWRRSIYPEYKASSTTNEDIYYEETITGIDLFVEFMRTQTNALVMKVPHCESDDIISVWCRSSVGCENLILSTDTDYCQLYNERTTIYSPVQKKFRTSEDVNYELFVKCIRGDKSDTIPSAFPRVRETKLKEAWNDQYAMVSLMETVVKVSETESFKVGDRFEFNKSMIDMTMIPDYIVDSIINKINQELQQPRVKATVFGSIGYLGKLGIKNQSHIFEHKEKLMNAVPVFTC